MKYVEGWNNTKSLGDVYLDENGYVMRAKSVDGYRALYPYRASKDGGWDYCSGCYKPAYFAKLMREGKAKWA